MADIEIKGLKELYDQLQQLPVNIEKNVMRGALRASAKVIQAEAQRRAPEAPPSSVAAKKYGATPGELKRSIRVSVFAKAGTVMARIRAGNKKAFYARWVEFGTAPHEERPKNSKSLFLAGVFREQVNHPGAKMHPFMRPAFDGEWRSAVDAAAEYIRARLPKEFGKL